LGGDPIEPKKRRLRQLPRVIPVRSLAPTVLTVLALCSGVTAIRFAIMSDWQMAAVAILLAGLFDSLDGRVARMIKGTSRFGAEMDSLSDVICFGVSPPLVLYFWSLEQLGGIGWAVSLLYCVCCALRLARFNILDRDAKESGEVQKHFVGIPAPGAAGLLLLPLYASLALEGLEFQPVLIAIYMVILALLMISQVPTYSFKYVRIERSYVVPILVGVVVFVGLLTSFFWWTIISVGMIYMVSIVVSAVRAFRNRNNAVADPVKDTDLS
jgi:CDP-diacylglycerol--serine O-phosphatidyltransferase